MVERDVSIVVVPRERYSYALRALESLRETTQHPYELIYVDVRSPPKLREMLEVHGRNMDLVTLDRYVTPNQARNIGLKRAEGKYVVFVDNDCELSYDCIWNLVGCAEDTGATVVAPVYYERSKKGTRMHMAGATVRLQDGDYIAKHNMSVPPKRMQTDLFEFHCVLFRREGLGGFDEHLYSALEQEDASLIVQKIYGKIVLEPKASATYVVGNIDRHDANYIKWRWSDQFNRSSVDWFVKKWGLKPGWGESTYEWCNEHRRRLLLLKRQWWRI